MAAIRSYRILLYPNTCNTTAYHHQRYFLTSSHPVTKDTISIIQTSKRCISSLLHRTLIISHDPPPSSGPYDSNTRNPNVFFSDLQNSISLVQKYDPSGYLPGILLASKDARLGYFAIRAFWIESGLRFKSNPWKDSISSSKQIPGVGQRDVLIPDHERIGYWKNAIESLYENDNSDHHSSKIQQEQQELQGQQTNSSTLRLLQYVIQKHNLSKCYFDRIILGRERDVDMKQYPTMQSLEDHVDMFCVSLLHLVLECGGIYRDENQGTNNNHDILYNTAKHVGLTHGLTNALRLSVPTASATGKVIIPQDLCTKYDIQSPRYLLSALGMGDQECKRSLQQAVRDIVLVAREHLRMAREAREEIARHHPMGSMALSAFLPALASETFLNRLEHHGYDLTDRTLRSVGTLEHLQCAQRLVVASWKKTF